MDILKGIKEYFGFSVLSEVQKRGYPEYEGRKLIFTSPRWHDGRPEKVRVVGCNYFIGFTLVNADDPKDYFACYHGPLSPIFKDNPMAKAQQLVWDKKFKHILKAIKTGVFDVAVEDSMVGGRIAPSMQQPSANNCSFGQ